jgi:hypothetical protein
MLHRRSCAAADIINFCVIMSMVFRRLGVVPPVAAGIV